jgi:hypothetical protein
LEARPVRQINQYYAEPQYRDCLFVQHQVNVLAWLHAGLVHELRMMTQQLFTNPAAVNAATGQVRDPEIVARARRIAAARAARQLKQ